VKISKSDRPSESLKAVKELLLKNGSVDTAVPTTMGEKFLLFYILLILLSPIFNFAFTNFQLSLF
jgi:hypothetical protein